MAEEKKKRGLMATTVIFLVIALVAFAFYAWLGTTFITAEQPETSEDAEPGEEVGAALGLAFALILLLVFALIAGGVFMIADAILVILATLLWRRAEGKQRAFGIGAVIGGVVFFVGAIVLFIVMLYSHAA